MHALVPKILAAISVVILWVQHMLHLASDCYQDKLQICLQYEALKSSIGGDIL